MPRGRPRGSKNSGDKPRGKMTSYAYFVQICRGEHKKNHPDENVQFADFSRQCADRWKTMSDKEKKKFHDMAQKDKSRYDDEMKDYVPSGGGTPRTGRGSRGRRTRKAPKDPNKPKRALSAFFYYANQERTGVRESNPDFSVGEVAKELGRRWNELQDGDKAKFEKQAEEDRARYNLAMKDYRAGVSSPAKPSASSNGHQDDDDDDDDMEDDEEDEDDD